MKKLSLILGLGLIAMGANAATLKLTMVGDKEIQNGETIVFNDGEIDQKDGYYTYWCFDPEIMITGSEAGAITLNFECTTGQSIQCCISSDLGCISGETVNIPSFNLAANTPTPMMFDYTEQPRRPGSETLPTDVTANVSVKYLSDETSEIKFTMIFNHKDENAVSNVREEDAKLIVNNGAIEYATAEAAVLNVYDTCGRLVISEKVNGNGSVATTGLGKGVYVYTLGAKSGKFLVK